MKRVLLLLAVLLFSAGTMMAQQDKAAEKAAKKAEKEAKKAAEAAEQMALFEQGVQALKEHPSQHPPSPACSSHLRSKRGSRRQPVPSL